MLNLNDYKIPGLTDNPAEIEAKKAAMVDAAVELVGMVPFLGEAVSAIKAYADTRAAELRYQQLTDWLTELGRRVEGVEATKIDQEWLRSEEGHRVFLALGEAASDLLRDEKVRLLAGAEFAASLAGRSWESDRKRFATIMIGMELECLVVVRVLAGKFGDQGDRWNIHLPRYFDEFKQDVGTVFGRSATNNITVQDMADALDDLRTYRLADVYREPTRGGDVSDLVSIFPRPLWRRFAAYLCEAVPAPHNPAAQPDSYAAG